MFKLKVEKKGRAPVEADYYGRCNAFTAAISHYKAENDKWGEGYLHAARQYVTAKTINAEPFSFWGDGEDGMRITISFVGRVGPSC